MCSRQAVPKVQLLTVSPVMLVHVAPRQRQSLPGKFCGRESTAVYARAIIISCSACQQLPDISNLHTKTHEAYKGTPPTHHAAQHIQPPLPPHHPPLVPPGFTEGRIKHVPSNQDLLKHMSAAVSGRMRGRSQSTNSLSTMARVRTRSPSLGDLHSVLESPAAHQLRHSQSAASQATHAEPDQQQDHVSVLPAQQQQQLGSSPAAAEQEAAADTGSPVLAAASEAAAAALGAVAEQSQQRGGSVVAAAAVSSGLAVDVPSSSSSPVQVYAAVCMTAESSAVVVPAGGECGNTSSGSPGSSFSEVEAAASSDAGHEGLSISM